jgi:hypothetical protein
MIEKMTAEPSTSQVIGRGRPPGSWPQLDSSGLAVTIPSAIKNLMQPECMLVTMVGSLKGG